jgi:acetolactate synthase I/II/III large subunit
MPDLKTEQLVPQRMLELMEAEGINTLFGIPDPCFVSMFVTAEQRGWRVIAPHHEQAGAFMADGLWRMTGKPGVIIGNEGPGVANLLPAAVCAAKENAPTIFIGGQRERRFDQQVRRGHFQYTAQPKFFEEAMKYVGTIEYAEQVDEIFHEAFRQALSGTPGPVYIEYPQDHSFAMKSFGPIKAPEKYRLVRQKADADALAEAVELLTSAKQPMIFLGTGAFASRAHEAVTALAKALNCPIIQTPGANARLLDVADQSAAYSTLPANETIAMSDVVLALGTEIGEPVHYGKGRHWAKGKTARKWIYVERDPTAIGVNRAIDVPLVGDLRDIVPQLTSAIQAKGSVDRMPEKFDEWNGQVKAEMDLVMEHAPKGNPIHPVHFAAEATKVLPRDTVIVRDGGAASIWTGAFNQCETSDVLWSGNFGHLGTGLPHAIGAQLAVGETRRVVLMTGDSAFLFHISELETAVRKNLPIVAVVSCDYSWGLEVKVYHSVFGDQSPETEAHWGTQVRLDKIAEGFGAYGEYVEKSEDIGPAVERALASGRPAVVQVPVDPKANADDVPGFDEFATWYGDKGYGADD